MDINIKISEEEWNEHGLDLLKKYSLADIVDYFAFVEMPKIEKESARRRQLQEEAGVHVCLKKDKND